MGYTQAQGMADQVREGLITLTEALTWHLQANHYPPIPRVAVSAALQAIRAYEEGDLTREIMTPAAITLPAIMIIEQLHLEAFLPERLN